MITLRFNVAVFLDACIEEGEICMASYDRYSNSPTGTRWIVVTFMAQVQLVDTKRKSRAIG